MNKLRSGTLILFTLFITCYGNEPSMDFERHLSHLNQVRHPNYKDGKPWKEAMEYIRDIFQEYGITDIQTHRFNTTITQAGGSSSEVEGVNIIGISEGDDKSSPIILVGADYDTAKVADPFRENGGGVACLLETIHLFKDRVNSEYFQNSTVIFVAFDLNTKEYFGANEGHSGSYFFVREWLNRYLLNGVREFLGAIILDSVTTYSTANYSQTLPLGFDLVFPEANADIERRGMRGDYLGFLYTKDGEDNPIRETFVNNYYRERILYKFRLQEMDVHLNFSSGSVVDSFETFNHQAQYNFWTNPSHALPAFLLFDTDRYRSEHSPYECSDDVGCSVEQFLTSDRRQFLKKTTNTIVQTLLQLQTTRKDDSDEKSSSTSQQASTVLLLAVLTAYIFRH